MKTQKHTHKLKKHTYKTGVSIFFCTLNCNYKVEAPLALGKLSICYECGKEFAMNEGSIKLIRPHCLDCGRTVITDENGKRHYVPKIKSVKIDDIFDVNKLTRGVSSEKNNEVNVDPADLKIDSLKDKLAKATNPFSVKSEAEYETVSEDDL